MGLLHAKRVAGAPRLNPARWVWLGTPGESFALIRRKTTFWGRDWEDFRPSVSKKCSWEASGGPAGVALSASFARVAARLVDNHVSRSPRSRSENEK